MKRLFELGNQYVRESDWKDLALVKFCLCAMGIMIGTQIPTKHKKVVVACALGVFVATYIPLMTKLFMIVVRRREDVQQSKDCIKFHYAEWTVKKELKLKKDGAFYVVSPWALTWDDENYYLVAYDAAAGIIKHYRVDKMQNTEILETDRKGEESFKNFDLAAFAKKTFGMYGGVDEEVTLECKNELAGVVIDRFGHDVWLIPQGEDHFKTRVLVSVSPQFFGWVTGIGPGMKIAGPENVKDEYKAYLQDVLDNY